MTVTGGFNLSGGTATQTARATPAPRIRRLTPDRAISRLIPMGMRVELRFESFNLLNLFNWGNPQTNFNSGQFGRITTQTGSPRILQFGVKHDF